MPCVLRALPVLWCTLLGASVLLVRIAVLCCVVRCWMRECCWCALLCCTMLGASVLCVLRALAVLCCALLGATVPADASVTSASVSM